MRQIRQTFASFILEFILWYFHAVEVVIFQHFLPPIHPDIREKLWMHNENRIFILTYISALCNKGRSKNAASLKKITNEINLFSVRLSENGKKQSRTGSFPKCGITWKLWINIWLQLSKGFDSLSQRLIGTSLTVRTETGLVVTLRLMRQYFALYQRLID